ATNPESKKGRPAAGRANYQLSYARSAPTENDPQSRWVLSEVLARDGIAIDDADGVHDRRTCHAYEEGFFDRFERRFLGFSRVTSVEGCTLPSSQRQEVQLDLKSLTQFAAIRDASAIRDSDRLTGIRRIDRTYANRSIYEAGLLLSEVIKDISLPAIVPGATSPTRAIENTYVLLDVGKSSDARRECFLLHASSASAAATDDRPAMRPMLAAAQGGRIEFPTVTRNGVTKSPCHPLPDFDRGGVMPVQPGRVLI